MYNIIVFGASTTQGAFDPEGSGWVNRLAAYTYQQTIDSGFTDKSLVYNCGVSGDRIEKLEKRYKAELEARIFQNEGTAVVFAIGINDSQVELATGSTKTPIDEYEAALRRMIQEAKAHGVSFVACVGLGVVDESKVNPKPSDPRFGFINASIRKFDAVLKSLAESEGALYIPIADLFDGKPQLTPDGLHPLAEGHRLMYERVKEYLEKAKII